MVAKKMKEKTADEWENYLEERHIPAMRVRELRETLADPQLKHRGLLHRHDNVPGVGKPVTVPVAAFKFAHDGPSLERPPARMGEHTECGAEVGRLWRGRDRGVEEGRARSSSMAKPRLIYFDAPVSRGEECRLALHLAGVDFEDVRIKFDAWPAHETANAVRRDCRSLSCRGGRRSRRPTRYWC